jgi:hypothetical protein
LMLFAAGCRTLRTRPSLMLVRGGHALASQEYQRRVAEMLLEVQ